MAAWETLLYFGLRVRPWDGSFPPAGNRPSPFQVSFDQACRHLRYELDRLEAADLIVELDVRPQDIRVDGYPRAHAKPVTNTAVRVDFKSKFGPVRMETNEYRSWSANIRAIGLSLEALRAVDRYGVSRRGEQYRGYAALPMSTDPASRIQTREEAEDIIEKHAGVRPQGITAVSAVRAAIRATHPDAGGDPDDFRAVKRAKEILGV